MASEILKVAIEKQQELNGFVISTSVDLAVPRRGMVLEINRIINEDGKILGIGPRPGAPPLNTQFKDISNMSNGKPIIIVEDGVFSGTTLKQIILELKKYNIKATTIIIGFAFPDGLMALRSAFHNEIIAINKLDNLIDWMPDHDFFPFAPNCGRVLGVKINNNILPFYSQDGISYSVPYILPFSPMSDWASIPKDYIHKISYFCMDMATKFYLEIDSLNNHKIKIKDIIGINPRISATISVKPKVFPTIHENIGEFLHSVHCESW